MNVLLLGSGGREHALAWKCAQSDLVKRGKLFALPGNPGIARHAPCIHGDVMDFAFVQHIVKKESIDCVIVGPEAPLVAGITDMLSCSGVLVFGPTMRAAQLEGSKVFSKELLKKHAIPSAAFETFSDSDEKKAMDYVEYLAQKHGYPVVIKADGLAAGKGVVIAQTNQEAQETLHAILSKKIFGAAGNRVIVEEFLDGEEASIMLVVSGSSYAMLAPSQDHKRVHDGDKGPNTGGMGAYAPCPLVDAALTHTIETTIVQPLMQAFQKENIEYKGVLYIGLMIVEKKPYVLEFNVRFGDPETQVILPLLTNDLVDVCIKTVQGTLVNNSLSSYQKSAVCVVCASQGYPGAYQKGNAITGLDTFENSDNSFVFHAGTALATVNGKQTLVTAGGRVLGVVGIADTLNDAIAKTYQGVEKIHFDGMHYRKDIGHRAIQ